MSASSVSSNDQLHSSILLYNNYARIKGVLDTDSQSVWHNILHQYVGFIQLNLTDLSLLQSSDVLAYNDPKLYSMDMNDDVIYAFCSMKFPLSATINRDVLLTYNTSSRSFRHFYLFEGYTYYTSISGIVILNSKMHIVGGRTLSSQSYVNHDQVLLPYSDYGIPNYLTIDNTFNPINDSDGRFALINESASLVDFTMTPISPSTLTSSPASSIVLGVDKIDSYGVWPAQSSIINLKMNTYQTCQLNNSIPYTSNTLNHSLSYITNNDQNWVNFNENNGTLTVYEAPESSRSVTMSVTTSYAIGTNLTTFNINVKECGIHKCDRCTLGYDCLQTQDPQSEEELCYQCAKWHTMSEDNKT